MVLPVLLTRRGLALPSLPPERLRAGGMAADLSSSAGWRARKFESDCTARRMLLLLLLLLLLVVVVVVVCPPPSPPLCSACSACDDGYRRAGIGGSLLCLLRERRSASSPCSRSPYFLRRSSSRL